MSLMDWICCFLRHKGDARSTLPQAATATRSGDDIDNEPTEREPLLRESRRQQPSAPRQLDVIQWQSDGGHEGRWGRNGFVGTRPRLPHEPSIFNYDLYEGYDRARKWLKDTAEGDKDLVWRTAFLDLHIEASLLRDYIYHWSLFDRRDISDAEDMKFYDGLKLNLEIDAVQVEPEERKVREYYGKPKEEVAWLMCNI